METKPSRVYCAKYRPLWFGGLCRSTTWLEGARYFLSLLKKTINHDRGGILHTSAWVLVVPHQLDLVPRLDRRLRTWVCMLEDLGLESS